MLMGSFMRDTLYRGPEKGTEDLWKTRMWKTVVKRLTCNNENNPLLTSLSIAPSRWYIEVHCKNLNV